VSIRQHTASLPNLLARLWYHLSSRRRRQFVMLTGLMLVSAFAEVVSLGAVLPFLGILVAPEHVFNHPIVADVAQAWDITSADQLVPLITSLLLRATCTR
jgi:ATP-binding cassette subfamily B protein